METTAMLPGRGVAGRKRVDGEAKTQSSSTTTARGGEAKLYHRKGENYHNLVPQSAWQNYVEHPPPRGGGSAGRKRNEHEKHITLCLNRVARLARPWPGTERGGRQDKTRRNTKNIKSWATIERPDHPDQPRHLSLIHI